MVVQFCLTANNASCIKLKLVLFFSSASCFPYFFLFQVFRYDGSGPVVKKEIDVLWDAVWQPAAQGVYPDRPASPGRKGPTAADTAAGERRCVGVSWLWLLLLLLHSSFVAVVKCCSGSVRMLHL